MVTECLSQWGNKVLRAHVITFFRRSFHAFGVHNGD